MLTLNLNLGEFIFKNIKKEELDDVLRLYNEDYESMYATGIDRDLSIEDIKEKYLEVLVNSYEFFAGIYFKNSSDMIGVIKGRIDYDDNEKFWISSFLIGKKYRKEGMGKRCVNEIIKFMGETYDIKTVLVGIISGNPTGVAFWESVGFRYYRTIKEFINFNSIFQDLIIMIRNI